MAHMPVAVPLLPVDRPCGMLISSGLARMGDAVPAAVGAALARPQAAVVALTGDGGPAIVLGELSRDPAAHGHVIEVTRG